MLAGVTTRPSYWGGTVLDLLDAVNACRITFMSAERPWLATDEDARALIFGGVAHSKDSQCHAVALPPLIGLRQERSHRLAWQHRVK